MTIGENEPFGQVHLDQPSEKSFASSTTMYGAKSHLVPFSASNRATRYSITPLRDPVFENEHTSFIISLGLLVSCPVATELSDSVRRTHIGELTVILISAG